jgi:hypothetical protein
MGKLTIRVAQDATMPVGRCVVLLEDDIVYIGRLGGAVLPFLDMVDAVLIISPADFADGMEYVRQVARPN